MATIKQEEIRVNHPDDLHVLKGLGSGQFKFMGYIGEMSEKARQLNQEMNGATQTPATPISISQPPQLITTKNVAAAFKNNDWNTIYKLQAQADKDLSPIYKKFEDDPSKSWVMVRDEATGMKYHVSYVNTGSYAWTFSSYVDYGSDPENSHVKFTCSCQYGTYSKNTNIMGIHRYFLGLVKFASELTVSGFLAHFVNRLLRKGINFLSKDLGSLLTDAAADAGLDALFTIGTYVMPIFVPCAVFVIIFIGISYLWKWLNKRFTIYININNWDKDNDWYIRNQTFSNAFNPGKDNAKSLQIKIPKVLPPGSKVWEKFWVPSDISSNLMHTLDTVVSYASLVYENDHHFAQGLSMALTVSLEKTNIGMSFAFQCPWSAKNAQYMEGTIQDPDQFLSKARSHWIESTATNKITLGNGTNVEATIDKLKGGDPNGEDTYCVTINIGK
ncbi:hypothetical protein CYY_008383 [Polysphondylium violaceum]|uniref:Uncharacterized protein n=1 Tax=Polysphondylium violaceum TaxID=133409 RepID=A0A8J4UXC4_9MYCE|nr:hypothetical protein CYY_008383 [Polysphondylium violaceum]